MPICPLPAGPPPLVGPVDPFTLLSVVPGPFESWPRLATPGLAEPPQAAKITPTTVSAARKGRRGSGFGPLGRNSHLRTSTRGAHRQTHRESRGVYADDGCGTVTADFSIFTDSTAVTLPMRIRRDNWVIGGSPRHDETTTRRGIGAPTSASRVGRFRRALTSGGRPTGVIVGLVAVALVFSGCLATGYNYVSHRNSDHTELYFKVPSRWKFFSDKQIILADNPNLSDKQLKTLESGRWLEAFTPDPKASVKKLGDYEAGYPMGTVYARELGADERQSYSLSSLRTEVLANDPLASNSPDKVLGYSEFTGPSGLRGSRMLVDIPLSSGKFVTFDQVAEVDSGTDWVFVIAVGCTVTCWRHYGGIVKQVMNSWTVRSTR